KRLRRPLLLRQALPGRGDVGRAQAGPSERNLRHIGTRQAHGREQLSGGRVAAHTPSAIEGDPQAAFLVHRSTIGMAGALLDPREHALACERLRLRVIEGVDRPLRRFGVIKHLPVRAERRTVRDHVALLEHDAPPLCPDTVQRTAWLSFLIIHRAKPQSAFRPDRAIIQTIVGKVRLDASQQYELACLRIEAVQPVLEPDDEPAAAHRRKKSRLLRCSPVAMLAACRVPTVQAPALDVDEPERRLARHPDRTLADLGADSAYMYGFHEHSHTRLTFLNRPRSGSRAPRAALRARGACVR